MVGGKSLVAKWLSTVETITSFVICSMVGKVGLLKNGEVKVCQQGSMLFWAKSSCT